MATYDNDLRLKEIASGDEDGTWGTSTNTNLSLIAESLGYATEASFSSDANATTTVADGATDPARAMYLKVTSSGSLTATRTLTIGPSSITRVMFIENATTGSQSIAISQGSGGNVTIPAGKTKCVYLDGAGAGAAVVDAFSALNTGALVAETSLTLASGATVTAVLDEDNMSSDSATALATQQSIKAYVDAVTPVDLTADVSGILPVANGGTGANSLAGLVDLTTDVSGVLPAANGGAGVIFNSSVQSTGFNAASGSYYMVDTSSAGLTATLPASPSTGDQIGFMDVTSSFDVNELTLGRNGNNVFGTAADGTIDIKGYAGVLVYTGATYGWMPMY